MRAVDTSQHVSLERSESKPGTGWGRGAETTASPLSPTPHGTSGSFQSWPTKKKRKRKKKSKLFVMGTALRVNFLIRAEVNE